HTHARTHAHTHTRTNTQSHTHTHTHTHARTPMCSAYTTSRRKLSHPCQHQHPSASSFSGTTELSIIINIKHGEKGERAHSALVCQHRHTHTQTPTHTDTHTHTHTQTHTHTHTHRHTETHRHTHTHSRPKSPCVSTLPNPDWYSVMTELLMYVDPFHQSMSGVLVCVCVCE